MKKPFAYFGVGYCSGVMSSDESASGLWSRRGGTLDFSIRSRFTKTKKSSGFSLVEAIVVVTIILILAAIAGPNIMKAVQVARLRSAGTDLAGLMQNARIMAAKSDTIIAIQYTTIGGLPAAYVDTNGNNTAPYTTGDPVVVFTQGVTPAAADPTGTPSAYTLASDTSGTKPYDNSNVLAFSPRGLPCNYVSTDTPPCQTPAKSYFVYYLNGPNGWVAVVVTRAGRTKVSYWNGSAWSN
jgi:prepilin-type N-terminal cleavage/methylation domain-containing protein